MIRRRAEGKIPSCRFLFLFLIFLARKCVPQPLLSQRVLRFSLFPSIIASSIPFASSSEYVLFDRINSLSSILLTSLEAIIPISLAISINSAFNAIDKKALFN